MQVQVHISAAAAGPWHVCICMQTLSLPQESLPKVTLGARIKSLNACPSRPHSLIQFLGGTYRIIFLNNSWVYFSNIFKCTFCHYNGYWHKYPSPQFWICLEDRVLEMVHVASKRMHQCSCQFAKALSRKATSIFIHQQYMSAYLTSTLPWLLPFSYWKYIVLLISTLKSPVNI